MTCGILSSLTYIFKYLKERRVRIDNNNNKNLRNDARIFTNEMKYITPEI